MKKTITKAMAVLMSLILVLMSAVPAMAENSSEVESYLNSTYAKAIDPYGSLKKDDEGRYIIPLSKTSVSLKKDTSSKIYTASWSSSDDSFAKVTNSSYSASAKITHPSYADGAKCVTLTLTLLDKTDGKTVLGTRDYVLYIEPKLPVYSLDVTAKNESGDVISNPTVTVTDSYGSQQDASALNGNTEYTLTVSAAGYVRDVRKITLTQNTHLDVTLKEGATVDFTVNLATGVNTDYATLKVTSQDGSQTYSPIQDEYGYDTSQFELVPGEYKYYATYQSGSQTAEGTFTVNKGDKTLNITINLKYTEYKVKFDVTPADAKITLKKNGSSGAYGDEILPDENGYYTVIFGQYRYTVEAENYITVSKTFNATDTSLKNNNYVITVKLTSPYDTILNKADDYLFEQSGDGMMMTEFSGVHTDGDFGYVSDVDSDYQDTNVIDTITQKVNAKVKSDSSLDVDDTVKVELNSVKNLDGDEDNTVIFKNGKIYYNGVDSLNYDEDFYGAVYDLALTLTYKNITKESEVRVVVPYHTYTRLERLDSAALYAVNFNNIKGNNKSAADVTADLDLINTANSDEYSYYSICSSWESDHPEIIDAKTGKVTRPEKDTVVKLTAKTYYSASFIEATDFFFDPGPLGDNAAYRTVSVVVKGTKQEEAKPSEPATTPATTPSADTTAPSTPVKAPSKPKKTSIKKLSNGKKKFTLSWSKISGVSGYQIQYSTDKKFKKNNKSVNIKKQKTTKTTVKNLKSYKKYYVRIRTYKTVNGKKVYSSWSKAKSVKTK